MAARAADAGVGAARFPGTRSRRAPIVVMRDTPKSGVDLSSRLYELRRAAQGRRDTCHDPSGFAVILTSSNGCQQIAQLVVEIRLHNLQFGRADR